MIDRAAGFGKVEPLTGGLFAKRYCAICWQMVIILMIKGPPLSRAEEQSKKIIIWSVDRWFVRKAPLRHRQRTCALRARGQKSKAGQNVKYSVVGLFAEANCAASKWRVGRVLVSNPIKESGMVMQYQPLGFPVSLWV